MVMSLLKRKVSRPIAAAIISVEMAIFFIAFFVGIYQGVNIKPISASTTTPLLQLNNLTNPGLISSNATLTMTWDYNQFFGGDKTKLLQFYACYGSYSNSLSDTGRCKSKNWPSVLNTGTYSVSLADWMIPTPPASFAKRSCIFSLS